MPGWVGWLDLNISMICHARVCAEQFQLSVMQTHIYLDVCSNRDHPYTIIGHTIGSYLPNPNTFAGFIFMQGNALARMFVHFSCSSSWNECVALNSSQVNYNQFVCQESIMSIQQVYDIRM